MARNRRLTTLERLGLQSLCDNKKTTIEDIDRWIVELYNANAAEPYDHEFYTAVYRVLKTKVYRIFGIESDLSDWVINEIHEQLGSSNGIFRNIVEHLIDVEEF